MEKIKYLIIVGYLNEALNEINTELGKSFDFNNKKSRNKYIELQNYKRELFPQLKSQKGKKNISGDILMPSANFPFSKFKDFFGGNSSFSTRIPHALLKQKFTALVSIANTTNPEYLELLYILANIIDEGDRSILFLGETGVGKSSLAEKIHYLGNRMNKPFKVVDCSLLSENLLESELFGHIKGAYNGAVSNRLGALKSAEGGTIFIDEIHRASRQIRNKLLNYFQEKKFKPLGSEKILKSDVRIIIGTNQDIEKLVDSGEIEENFYNRIVDRVLTIPPLRQRKEDFPNLIKRELMEYNKIYKRNINIEEETIEILAKYNWPGNHRQLHKYIFSKLDDCNMYGLNSLTSEFVKSNPPRNKIMKTENPFNELEEALSKTVQLWNPEDGKFISDLIEPLLANIYMNKMNGKKTKASKIIQIDGSGGPNSTIDQKLVQYKLTYDKFLKN